MASRRKTSADEYEVAKVLDVKGQGDKRQYLVKWKGYPLSESTWEPRSHFEISPERIMHRPSRSTSRGRKSDAPSPSRRLASNSPSRSKTASMRSSPTKGEGVMRRPLSKKNSATRGNLAKSPARNVASSKSPVKRAISDKKRLASKSPSRASKRTPSKQKATVKSSEKPAARSRSRSRPSKQQIESKSTQEVPAAPTPISSTAFTKHFEPSFLQPFTRSTAFPLRSATYGATAAREPSEEMAIRHRAPASGYPCVISQSARSRKMAELKKYAPIHFRSYWRFYVIVFSLAIIGLIIYHFGYSVRKTLKQLQKQMDSYIYSMKKQ